MSLMTDPDEMRSYSSKFHAHGEEILSESNKAYASAQSISGGGWTGKAEAASFNTMTDLQRAFKNIYEQMMFTSQNLAQNADIYEHNEADAARALQP
jgi:hypothetical protein